MTATTVEQVDPRKPLLKVLLVTANTVNLRQLRSKFSDQGHSIFHTSSVDQAIALLKDDRVNVAAVDLDMPDFDGLTLVGQLWNHNPDLPVLTFGAREHPVKGEAALHAGVVSHFSGSPDPDAMLMAAMLSVGQAFAKPHALARQLMQTSGNIAVLASERQGSQNFLQRSLQVLVQHFAADRGSLFLLDKQNSDRLRVMASHGIDPSFLKDVQPGQGVTGKVFQSGHGQLILSDLHVQPGFESCKPVDGVTASMCVPIRDLGKNIGVVNISSMKMHTLYTPRDLEALEFLASNTAEMLRQNQVLEAQSALRAQIDSVERLALAGELTAGIAHEIKNPLAYVRSNLSVLKEYTESIVPLLQAVGVNRKSLPVDIGQAWDDSEAQDVIDDAIPLISECLDGIERCMTIVGEVKTMVRADSTTDMGQISLCEVVDQALKLTRTRISARATVKKSMLQDARILGNPVQLVQVMVNLLNNAADAIEAKPQDQNGQRGEIQILSNLEGDTVQLSVADSGIGMCQDTIDRAFNPLFTSKSKTGGTGLGLGIVKRIVTSHGGTIEIDSQEGSGTTMRLLLPLFGSPVVG